MDKTERVVLWRKVDEIFNAKRCPTDCEHFCEWEEPQLYQEGDAVEHLCACDLGGLLDDPLSCPVLKRDLADEVKDTNAGDQT
jgi:hypothetical protein